jgi:hypothetical protein
MRKFIKLIFLVFFSLNILAQKYGNEWVSFTQTYVKFPIYKEGIYRIDSTVLAQKFNLQFVNPHSIQIFLNGKQIPLYIHGDADGKINTGDYIEFYASHLRPDFDSLLFHKISHVANPYKPMYYDTIYAFLTVHPTSTVSNRYLFQSDTTIANYPLTNHAYSLALHIAGNNFNNGIKTHDWASADPRYTQEEGWGAFLTKNAQNTTSFSNLTVFSSTLPARFQVRFCGQSAHGPNLDHRAQITYTNHLNSSVLLYDTMYYAYSYIRKIINLPANQIGNNSNFTFISADHPSFSNFNNQTFLFFMELFYPKQTNLQSMNFSKFFVNDVTGSSKQSFVFTNVPSLNMVAYDIKNNYRFRLHVTGGNVRMVVPNTGNQKIIVLASQSDIINITQLRDVNNGIPFTNFNQPLHGKKAYVIVYHPKLINGASAYRNYRQSIAGGNYQVIFANIHELEEQFGHGIPKNPLMIKNFLRFLYDTLSEPPSYCFLIGKSVMQQDIYNTGPVAYNKCLIPTYGYPAADNLLSAGIAPGNTLQVYPDIPIGRLAAQSDNDINIYLNKVIQHEQLPNQEWKKNVLHFVGGDSPSLSYVLDLYMSGFKNIISDSLYGGNVYTFRKNTSAPIQTSIADSVKMLIEKGSSLLTFYGHGSAFGFDQAIDNPDLFNNAGKYYFVFSLSCFSGDIHKPYNYLSVGENYLFKNNRGAIGYLSNTGIGYVHALKEFADKWYRSLAYFQYAKGMGDVIRQAAIFNQSFMSEDIIFNTICQTLHGDPAIHIGPGNRPDYEIKNSDVKISQNLNVDSLEIKIRYRNLGRVVLDSFMVKTIRTLPNGDSLIYQRKVKAPFYADSIRFRVPLDPLNGIGLNKFWVKVDAINTIIESNENNNSTIGSIDIMVMGGDLFPVYPYNYAVVPQSDSITLKASTTDPFAPERRYVFQLDTTDTFLTPIYQTTVTSKGGVVETRVPIPFGDSTVYFWRVSRDSVLPTDRFVWRERSFQEIGNKKGWSQYHIYQFKNNRYRFVRLNRQGRNFVFLNTYLKVFVENMLYPFYWPLNIRFFFNNQLMEDWSCSPDGWNFAVFDTITGEPDKVVSLNYPNSGAGQYNNCICEPNQIFYVYSFSRNQSIGAGSEPCGDNPNWKTDIINFINAIPNGKYVLAYTVGKIYNDYAQISQYDNNLYNAFESIGAVNIRNITDTVPYILFGKKGMTAGQGHEVAGQHQRSQITLLDSTKTNYTQGYIASEIIGPSYKWQSLHWGLKFPDSTPGDTTLLKVVGIKSNGQIDTLATFPKDSTDVYALYNYADAGVYPYLQLVALMKDRVNLTSPQLRKWMVLYEQAPECAVNPKKGFKALNDTLMEGDQAVFVLPIENIGKEIFKDSLLITYKLEDQNANLVPLPHKLKKKNFSPGEILYDTIKVPSLNLAGLNAVWVYVNKPGHPKYQKEQEFFNNIARLPFRVNRDITNPLLDVTFDGVHILNNDIVSPEPEILISLRDENLFLALNDTSDFTIQLRHPGQSTYEPVYFLNRLEFTPAQLPDNSCRIRFTPTFTAEGNYELRVQGKDRSGNYSGAVDYKIQFEVILKSMISNVMNYPNPFSTSTRFVFTLTGSKIPDVFTIQIMTISGKVVKEITREELGPIRIGRNITQYAWDGRDMFGDRLANGVYLYRVITRMDDEKPEHFSTGADKFFKNGFGKMVLMR